MAVSGYFRLSRYRGPAGIVLAVFVTFFLIDRVLAVVVGDPPPYYPRPANPGIEGEMSRVLAAEQIQQAGRLNPDQLVIVLGMSGAGKACDPRVLEENDPRHRRWLVVSLSGTQITLLEDFQSIALDDQLKAKDVVIGLSEVQMLGGLRVEPRRTATEIFSDFLHGHFSFAAATDLERYLWLEHYHDTDWHIAYREECWRGWLLSQFGLRAGVTVAPLDDPWAATEIGHGADIPLELKRNKYVYADPGRFSDLAQVEALKRIVHTLRSRGMRVTCVLLPESSLIGALNTPEVDRFFKQGLAIAGGNEPVPLIDLRKIESDRLFEALQHLTPEGRDDFSKRFPALLP